MQPAACPQRPENPSGLFLFQKGRVLKIVRTALKSVRNSDAKGKESRIQYTFEFLQNFENPQRSFLTNQVGSNRLKKSRTEKFRSANTRKDSALLHNLQQV